MGGEEVPESSAVIWRGGAAFLNVSVDLESLELQWGRARCARALAAEAVVIWRTHSPFGHRTITTSPKSRNETRQYFIPC